MFGFIRRESKELPDLEGPVHVFARYCFSSSISQHKVRPQGFSHALCYENLLQTIDLENARLTLFFDGAKGSLQEHFLAKQTRFPVVEINAGSEANAFLQMLEYVKALNLPRQAPVYFVEDDYLHRPGWVKILREGLQIPFADYVTLYDHRDKYLTSMYPSLRSQVFVSASCHWRETPSTTNTFATRFATLLRDHPLHEKFSKGREITKDHAKFIALGKRNKKLISSIPGWSTHAETAYLSPCTEWESYFCSPLTSNP